MRSGADGSEQGLAEAGRVRILRGLEVGRGGRAGGKDVPGEAVVWRVMWAGGHVGCQAWVRLGSRCWSGMRPRLAAGRLLWAVAHALCAGHHGHMCGLEGDTQARLRLSRICGYGLQRLGQNLKPPLPHLLTCVLAGWAAGGGTLEAWRAWAPRPGRGPGPLGALEPSPRCSEGQGPDSGRVQPRGGACGSSRLVVLAGHAVACGRGCFQPELRGPPCGRDAFAPSAGLDSTTGGRKGTGAGLEGASLGRVLTATPLLGAGAWPATTGSS